MALSILSFTTKWLDSNGFRYDFMDVHLKWMMKRRKDKCVKK